MWHVNAIGTGHESVWWWPRFNYGFVYSLKPISFFQLGGATRIEALVANILSGKVVE